MHKQNHETPKNAQNISYLSKKQRFFIKKCLNDIAAAQGFYGLADMSISLEDLSRIHGQEVVKTCVLSGWIGSKPPGCAPISPFQHYQHYQHYQQPADPGEALSTTPSSKYCPAYSSEYYPSYRQSCHLEGCTYCWLTDHGHKTLAALVE